jgi:hypothetical protein
MVIAHGCAPVHDLHQAERACPGGVEMTDPMTVALVAYGVLLPVTLLAILPLVFRAAVARRRDPLPWFLATMFLGPLALAIYLYPARPARLAALPMRTPSRRIPHGAAHRSPSCPLCGEDNPVGHICHPARVEDRIHGRVVTRIGELPFIH